MSRARRGWAIVAGITLLLACGDEGSAPLSFCAETSECERHTNELAASLRRAASAGDESLLDRACVSDGATCECRVAIAETDGSEILLARRRSSTCDLYSRGGPCLVGPFAGCTLAEDCDAPCAELVMAYREDRARVFDVDVRQSECLSFGDARTCVTVVDVDDRCYAYVLPQVGLGATSYSCEQTDDEILDMAGIRPD